MPYVSEFDEDKLELKIGHGCPIFKPSPKTPSIFQMTLKGLELLRLACNSLRIPIVQLKAVYLVIPPSVSNSSELRT